MLDLWTTNLLPSFSGHTPPHAGAHSSHHMMYSQQQVSHQNTQPPRAPAGSVSNQLNINPYTVVNLLLLHF